MAQTDMAPMASDAVTYRRSPRARHRWVLDGVLIVTPQNEPMRLMAPGDLIWQELETPQTIDEITKALGEVFAAPKARIRTDVAGVIEQLVAWGAVRSSD